MYFKPHVPRRSETQPLAACTKLITFVLLLGVLAWPSTTARGEPASESVLSADGPPAPSVVLPGDFDFDGKVTRADAVAFYRVLRDPRPFLAENPQLTTDQTLALGDLNADQRINQADLALLIETLRDSGQWDSASATGRSPTFGMGRSAQAGGGQVFRAPGGPGGGGGGGGAASAGGGGGAGGGAASGAAPSRGSAFDSLPVEAAADDASDRSTDRHAPADSTMGTAASLIIQPKPQAPATTVQVNGAEDRTSPTSVDPHTSGHTGSSRQPVTGSAPPSSGGATVVHGGEKPGVADSPTADISDGGGVAPGQIGTQHGDQLRAVDQEFQIFDALLYRGKPDLVAKHGMVDLRVIYAGELWQPGQDRSEPIERNVRWVGRRLLPGQLVCVDIEHWPLHDASESEVQESVRKLRLVMRWLREEAPAGTAFGFYMVLPIRDYWAPIEAAGKATPEMADWQAQNEMIGRELADTVDVVFPSLYTFYDNPAAWEVYARANLTEARRFGKPVYPFLWPTYHQSNAALAGRSLSADLWRLQLEVCRQLADGVVLWGGHRTSWSETADWWEETKQFLKSLRAG